MQSQFARAIGKGPPRCKDFNWSCIPPSTCDLSDLDAPFTKEEVRGAIYDLPSDKAPGPDGFHAIFYKRFWPMLGDDLVMEVLVAVNSCNIPEGWNDTTIVMIPKVKDLEKVTQFRPISLCNVVYKVISKMLASRLKLILPEVINPTQSAFVPGLLITDNVLVAYESFHVIKTNVWARRVCVP